MVRYPKKGEKNGIEQFLVSSLTETGTITPTFSPNDGCVQTAGEANSNQIPSQLQFFGLTVHVVNHVGSGLPRPRHGLGVFLESFRLSRIHRNAI